jgi:calcium-translocating P-type ATPase
VTGEGYDPHGEFQRDGTAIEIERYAALCELTRATLLCNDAALVEQGTAWTLHGDPTEGALLALGMKAGLDPELQQAEWPRMDVIPFESEHRFMATLHHDHAGHAFAYVKGAPERILTMCSTQRSGGEDTSLDHAYWEQGMHDMAAQGQRLLAVAVKVLAPGQQALGFADVERGLTLLGVVGIIDPPREEAIRAVAECHAAGIRVKMITGDHALTAAAIGAQIGIGDGRSALSGHEIDEYDDARLQEVVARHDVFARASPEHKLRLVEALQARAQVVAMTGDGVNDAPALKRADVGIAMGRKGTEAAKEAAEMVLADDNFASIANAVEEGRTVYDNLKKAILFILPTNGGQALSIIAAILIGRALPITPVQILWVNMVTAVTLALALAFEPPEPGLMRRTPRDPGEPLLSGLLVWRIAFVSLLLVSATLGTFLWAQMGGASLEYARTLAVNTLVVCEIFYLFNSRYVYAPVLSPGGLLGNRSVLIAVGLLVLLQLAFTYLPPAQQLFSTVPLALTDWLPMLALGSAVLVLVEIEKLVIRRMVVSRQSARRVSSGSS